MSARRKISRRERWEAIGIRNGLALRMESLFPVGAAAVMNGDPRLEAGVLVLAYEPNYSASFKQAVEVAPAFKDFTDHPVRIVRAS